MAVVSGKTPVSRPYPASPPSFSSVVVRFRRLALTHVVAALFAHFIFLLVFWALEVWILAVANVVSVLIYVACLVGLKYPRLRSTTQVLSWFEIIAHAAIASLVLGPASGFHYHLLALVPLLFIDPHGHVLARFAGLIILTGLFIGLDLLNSYTQPWVLLGSDALDLMRGFNSLLCFLSLGSLVNFYARTSRKSERDLRKLASTDLLTGLSNRRHLIEKAARHTKDDQPEHQQLAFILVDLDHFKQLNDRYGHAFGDEVLSRTARLMDSTLRPDDSLARWGGEEFLVLVTNADLEEATRVAERLRAAIASQRFCTGENTVQVTATLGVSRWKPYESLESCVSRADEALYRGKQKGRNRAEVSDDDRASAADEYARPVTL